MFMSIMTLGFKARLAKLYFLFRCPGLLIRKYLAINVVVPAVIGLLPSAGSACRALDDGRGFYNFTSTSTIRNKIN